MATFHALVAGAEGDPLLIRLPLGDARRTRAVVATASGSPRAVTADVRVTRPAKGGPTLGEFPITVDDEQHKLTLSAVAATGHLAFSTSLGLQGVIVVGQDTPVAHAMLDPITTVAIVAILAIAVMVVANQGGSVTVTGPNGVTVSTGRGEEKP